MDRLIGGTTERLEINQKPIICSGTTLGTRSSIRDYLDRFTQEADRYLLAFNVVGIEQFSCASIRKAASQDRLCQPIILFCTGWPPWSEWES
jgi:hypothetical protein